MKKMLQKRKKDQFKDFKKISSSQKIFNKIISLKKNLKFKLP